MATTTTSRNTTPILASDYVRIVERKLGRRLTETERRELRVARREGFSPYAFASRLQARDAAPAGVTVTPVRALQISAPAWFAREDFRIFIEGQAPYSTGRPATWHQIGEVGDGSDVFVTFDAGEGSDRDAIPDDIWATITAICAQAAMTSGLLQLSPGYLA